MGGMRHTWNVHPSTASMGCPFSHSGRMGTQIRYPEGQHRRQQIRNFVELNRGMLQTELREVNHVQAQGNVLRNGLGNLFSDD